jgi:hypothetical protein
VSPGKIQPHPVQNMVLDESNNTVITNINETGRSGTIKNSNTKHLQGAT